jgi:3-hydroxyisobutyrate dehydrogenase
MLTVGVIGTGRMGAAMAARLARAGFEVTVWNRDESKARAVADAVGARVGDSASAVASSVDVVITSLADDDAVRSVYLGDEGVVAGIGPGTVALETSTIDPLTVLEVGSAVDATGAGFLDCPVSGSVSTVEAGTLTIMAGGDHELVERARPVLEPLSSRVIEVGPRGSGAATKLAVNGLVHGLNLALAEALVLAERAGVSRSTAYDVFASGAPGAPFVQYKREAYEHPDEAPVAFSLDLVRKDLELITGLGERVGAPMGQASAGLEIVDRAIAAGMGDRDMSAIATYLRGMGA